MSSIGWMTLESGSGVRVAVTTTGSTFVLAGWSVSSARARAAVMPAAIKTARFFTTCSPCDCACPPHTRFIARGTAGSLQGDVRPGPPPPAVPLVIQAGLRTRGPWRVAFPCLRTVALKTRPRSPTAAGAVQDLRSPTGAAARTCFPIIPSARMAFRHPDASSITAIAHARNRDRLFTPTLSHNWRGGSVARVARRSREWNCVAHVGEAGHVRDRALEAQAEAGVRHRAVAAQIAVPGIVLLVEFGLRHASFQHGEALL